jgi:hypothetical protein
MSDTPGTRTAKAGPSVSTVLSVVVAVIAVLLGFLILRDINRDNGGGASGGGDTTEAPDVTTDLTATTTTVPASTTTTLVTTGFEVMVANASGVGGTAGQMTTALQAKGFVTTEPTNAAAGIAPLATTVVYTLPGFEAGAESVASVLGGVEVLPMPTPIPTEDASLGSASVLVMLGTDLAGKPLPTGTGTGTPQSSLTTTTTSTTVAG